MRMFIHTATFKADHEDITQSSLTLAYVLILRRLLCLILLLYLKFKTSIDMEFYIDFYY